MLSTMPPTWVAQSNQLIVRANRISAMVAVLKRHATIAEKKPETDTARPNPMKRSIPWMVALPNPNSALHMASMTLTEPRLFLL